MNAPGLAAALLAASLHGAVLAALVWCVTRLAPRLPGAAKAALWWLVAARFLLALLPLPAVELRVLPAGWGAAAALTATWTPTPTSTGVAPLSAGRTPAPRPSPLSPNRSLAPPPAPPLPLPRLALTAPLALWLAGALVAALHLLRDRLRLSRLLATASPVAADHPARQAWASLGAGRSRLLPAAALLESPAAAAPLCAGLLAPRVVLPVAAARLPAEALRLALAHELAHLRRGDLWLAWAPAAAGVLFWFHPAARLAAAELGQAREEACDAWALRATGAAPAQYGRLLLHFGLGHAGSAFAAAAGAPHVRHLERRLHMLQRFEPVLRPRTRLVAAASLAVAAIAAVPVAVTARVVAPQLEQAEVAPTTAIATPTPSARAFSFSTSHGGRVSTFVVADAQDDTLVFFDGPSVSVVGSSVWTDGDEVTLGSARPVRLERLKALRGGRQGPFAVVARKGALYLVEDPQALSALSALHVDGPTGEEAEVAVQQAELNARQAALGQQQARLGVEEADLAAHQAALEVERARAEAEAAKVRGDAAASKALEARRADLARRQAALDAHQQALGAKQEALGRQQEALGGQQERLGLSLEAMGRRQEAAAHRLEAELRGEIDAWIGSGAAKRVE